jgi:dihydroorotate dehydrogenase (fumarate)
MCGADAVQMVSALLRGGAKQLDHVRRGMVTWMEEKEYGSLSQMRGSMNLKRCPDPRTYERANYVHHLQTWHGDGVF